MPEFTDQVTIDGVRRRQDGALLVDARVARTGIQLYRGREVDPKNENGFRDKPVVRVYRPGSEVFSQDSLASMAHRPVTRGHPTDRTLIDQDNWKKWAIGNTADEVRGEGIFVRVPLMISDGEAISAIENGERELSSGYTSILDWTPGTTDAGEEYDAVQREIRYNHVALVPRGRAGEKVRIGDADWGAVPLNGEGEDTMTDIKLRQVSVDGLTVETTEQGAQVISKLQGQLAQALKDSDDLRTNHDKALAERDAQLAKKDAEINELKTKVLDAAALDKLVAARAAMIADAKLVAKDLKVDGLDDAGIRKATVVAALGDKAVEGKSQAYIDARFDVLVEDARKKGTATQDQFRQVVREGTTMTDGDDPRPKAYQEMIDSFNWKPPADNKAAA